MKAKLLLDGNRYELQSCTEKIYLLGLFLIELGCENISSIKQDILENKLGGLGNILLVDIDDERVILSDSLVDEENQEEEQLRISKKSFFHILNEWEKICKERPQEVLITREDDKFIFEIKK